MGANVIARASASSGDFASSSFGQPVGVALVIVKAQLVLEGCGRVSTFRSDVKYAADFLAPEGDVHNSRLGFRPGPSAHLYRLWALLAWGGYKYQVP